MIAEFLLLEKDMKKRKNFNPHFLVNNLASIIDQYWELGQLRADNTLLQLIEKLGRKMKEVENVPTYTATLTEADIPFSAQVENVVPVPAYNVNQANHVGAAPEYTEAPPGYLPRGTNTNTQHVHADAPPGYTPKASPHSTHPSSK